MKSILIVEPHRYHYEIIPGIVYYFRGLSYDINLLVQENFIEEDIFCRFRSIEDISVMRYKEAELIKKLNSSEIREYDFVFFNSYEYFHDNKKERLLDYLGYVPQSKYGILGIIHNKELLNDKDIPFLQENRIFALTPFRYKEYEIKLLSASYFGESVNRKYISTSERKRLLMIGASNSRELAETALNNFNNSMVEVGYIGNINQNKELCRILQQIIHSFRIQQCKQNKFHYKAWKSIKYYGKIDFSSMYDEIESADYIMMVMDMENPKYIPFLEGKTSGSKQLVLGFNKPCIICEKFGKAFGFDNANAVFYEGNDLIRGFERVLEMSQNEYLDLKYNLDVLHDKFIVESKDNLLKAINKITYAIDYSGVC